MSLANARQAIAGPLARSRAFGRFGGGFGTAASSPSSGRRARAGCRPQSIGRWARKGWGVRDTQSSVHGPFSPSMAAARVSSCAADRPPPEKDRCLAIPQAQPLPRRRQSERAHCVRDCCCRRTY
ncbi:hypothetical protein M409DRAFT_59591 [Zasmidium cellare ATCC 36951]|uniref:Uncharacterized protein n=1 Tax=Zasmidium cellare ATCC 36951 TaxID=1080233 RepID=A0A6A6C5X8_ZASCE|nr:uncharacterized protein M409DRAFT_59591 [Zasmidium cellare ATCC 36951]KAF2160796.1 hypothetical protein M409DRAFT_59591 [Zasmidium cellare ATCC 36951]